MLRLKLLFIAILLSQIFPTKSAENRSCSLGRNEEKFDCYPSPGAYKEACEGRGCCWKESQQGPWCYYPKNYGGYHLINHTITENGQLAFWRRSFPSSYPDDVPILRIDINHQTEFIVRVKISDPQEKRFEAPYPKILKCNSLTKNTTYTVDMDPEKAGFTVIRNDGDIIFNSQNIGGFIFANQFLQISSPFEGKIYGLGEHRTKFWLDDNWQTYTLFNHDAAPKEGVNLYGSHPFYLIMQPSGKSFGVFLHNSNAIDVILQPLPAITFRSVGGIFDFYFFTGPWPSDVIRQYTELIGRSFMPPYWALGFHLCRFGFANDNVTRAVWKRNRDAGIPFDVMWNDIDYMNNRNDFTIDEENFSKLPDLVKDIHLAGMRYVVILDPGVSASETPGTYPPYDEGIAADIFVKNHEGKVFIGKVWNPSSTAFPDFTNPKTQKYWTKQIRNLRIRLPFDGLWIDMNEPSNFLNGDFTGCPDSPLENPPYVPGVNGRILRSKTICMTAVQYAGLHYNLHNLYGISEHDMTYSALRDVIGKRVFTISRSTYPGSGKYGGHWSGDIFSSWHDLTKSVPDMLSFSIYGVPFTGSDICGFRGNTSLDLCNRWMQLGAFYPFSRNHNDIHSVDQDPAALGQIVIDSSVKALRIRYTLLPYLYTLFYYSHVNGDTVVRPLFFEYPWDKETHTVDRSFLWGSSLYVVPVTEGYSTSVKTYVPEGKWYDWYTDDIICSPGKYITLNAPSDRIPLLVRGGFILPTQEPAPTTNISRKNNFTLMAFADKSSCAKGSLFWDDGETLDTIENGKYGLVNFTLHPGRFSYKVIQWQTPEVPILDSVVIRGMIGKITEVKVLGKSFPFIYKANVLLLRGLDILMNECFEITWV